MEVVKTTKKKEKSILAKNIIEGRERIGLSAEKFAEKARIPYPTLRDIEADISGGRSSTLEKIARALSVEEWQLKQPDLFFPENPAKMSPSEQSEERNASKNEVSNRHNKYSANWANNELYQKTNVPNTEDQIHGKIRDEIDNISNHGYISDQNTKNFSPDRASTILEIQSLLNQLEPSQLEMIKASAQNLLSLNTKNRKQVKD